MSKAAMKKVHYDYPGKHTVDNPLVICVGKFRVIPRNYKLHPDLNDLQVGEQIDILFSSDDYMTIPSKLRYTASQRMPLVDYAHPRLPESTLSVNHEVVCMNSQIEAYHPGDLIGKTADIIYRAEVMLVPKEYAVYSGKDGFRAFMELDFCEHCIENVWPEVKIWIDKYNITISGKDFYNPEMDISNDLAKNFSIHPKMTEV